MPSAPVLTLPADGAHQEGPGLHVEGQAAAGGQRVLLLLDGVLLARLETGAEIQVPLFVEQGTRVKVDTRDGSYLGRVN